MTDSLARAEYLVFVSQVHYCALYAIVVWEWIINIPAEYRLFWRASWTLIKVAYLFCRYWVLATIPYHLWAYAVNHTMNACLGIYKFPPALATFNMLAAELILVVRTYAFFKRDRRVLVFLLVLLSGVLGYQLTLTAVDEGVVPFFSGDTGPCLPGAAPHARILGYFLGPVAFDTILTVMTVYKALDMRRRNGPSSPIVQVFLREGILYYFLITSANLVNGIFYLQPRADISAIMIPWTIMLGPILACRLVLDIRQRGETLSVASHTRVPIMGLRPQPPEQTAVSSIPNSKGAGSDGAGLEVELGYLPSTTYTPVFGRTGSDHVKVPVVET